MPKILVAYYSTYGHVHALAQAVADGARKAGGDVDLKRFPEVIPDDKLEQMGALDAHKQQADVPELAPNDLADYDAVLFGFPTRYGGFPQQVAAVLDRTGSIWGQGKLVGKIGSVFTSTSSQHGGQETTCFAFYTFMIHMGMLISGVPYAREEAPEPRRDHGRQPLRRGHDRRPRRQASTDRRRARDRLRAGPRRHRVRREARRVSGHSYATLRRGFHQIETVFLSEKATPQRGVGNAGHSPSIVQ